MNRGLTIIGTVGVLVIVGLVIGIAVVGSSKNKGEATCATTGCSNVAARVLKDMDPKIKPCDNFYKFACGGYRKSAPIPEGEFTVDPFVIIRKEIIEQLRASIEEPSSPNDPKSFTLAKNYYRTCMNTSGIEKVGLKPLYNILRQLGNWPVVEGDNWNENAFDWVNSVYKSRKLGYSAYYFITMGMGVDLKDSTKYRLVLDQATFGLSHEHLIEGKNYSVVQAYYDYMVDIAVLLGADKRRATKELGESLYFELKLAEIALPVEERTNLTLTNNPMTIAQLNNRYPIMNWEEYANNMLPESVRVDVNEVVIVKEPSFVSGFQKLLTNTPKRVLANYLLWRIISDSAKYLNEPVTNYRLKFEAAIMQDVVTDTEPRWKTCLNIVTEGALSLSTSAMYVRKYFKEEARQNVVEMVASIRSELIKILKKADWMDEQTRSRALDKAVSMISLVGYPVELLDDKEIDKIYAPLDLKPNDFFGNFLKLEKLQIEFVFSMLRSPVNKTFWISHEYSTDVNAFYDPAENSIQIPAGILQHVFFNNDRPRYMNYGAMGFLVGHEMSHSFDNQGRQFDKDGNLVDWWTPTTEKKYLQKAQCIIDQANNYTVESVGLNVDGVRTLGENIADNGGIKVAYQAYKEYAKKNGPEPKLPGLEYTPEQMFWISAANVWCSRYRADAVAYELTTDAHSPEVFRVIGPLSNSPEFAADFNCPVGSYMNPAHKCSVL